MNKAKEKTERMKAKAMMLFVLLAAGFASCSQDDVLQGTVNNNPEGLQPVTLSVALPDEGMQTRATAYGNETDELPTRCFMEIWTGTKMVSHDEQTRGTGSATFSFSAYLDPKQTYTFYFWADDGTSYAVTDGDLSRIAVADGKVVGIAYRGTTMWSNDMSPAISATLTHAVGKLTLKTTGAVNTGNKITMQVPSYTQYNAREKTYGTGAADETPSTLTYTCTTTKEITGTAAGEYVCHVYTLMPDETTTVNLRYNEQSAKEVTNVPLAPNRHTILVGDVAHLGLTTATLTATIDEDWAGTEPQPLESYTYDSSTNTYTVYDAKGLQAWAEHVNAGNQSTNCTLAADITLPKPEEGKSNWTTVGTYDIRYAGTFDGAGHTISNLVINEQVGFIYFLTGTVKNLHIKDAVVTSNYNNGDVVGIVCTNYGMIAGCSFTGSVRHESQRVGGIAVENHNGKIIACCSSAVVTSNGSNAGGVVTNNVNSGIVLSCYSTSTATGSRYVGSVIGFVDNGGYNPATVAACYWGGNAEKGIGYSVGSVDCTKVDGTSFTWQQAAMNMNEALKKEGYTWQWQTNTGADSNEFPLIVVEKE